MAEVTSIVRDRGRALGIVAVLVMSAALVWAPTSFGAGDPIKTGTFNFKRSGSFKHQLKKNHVKLTPKVFSIKVGSTLDPTTGAGTINLGKIVFKKGHKKFVFGGAKATLGSKNGSISSPSNGKLFSVKGGTVTRNGFGADVSGVKLKLLKSAAKHINKALGLHSLHAGSAGSLAVTEQPETVQVLAGPANCPVGSNLVGCATVVPTPPPVLSGPPVSVTAKLQYHCVDPPSGVVPTRGAAQDPLPTATFHFPVTGGTVGPDGHAGVIQLAGGVKLTAGAGTSGFSGLFPQPSGCSASPNTTPGMNSLEQYNLAPDLGQANVPADVVLAGTGSYLGGPGDKGIAIGQVIDMSKATVTATPPSGSTPGTIKVTGAQINNNQTASDTLNNWFPQPGTPDPTKQFANGDPFGTATLTVQVR